MRFFLPVALLLMLAGCSGAPSEQPDSDDDTALGDDELNAVNNKMGLRLVYDEPTNRVRATLKKKLQPGQKLKLRVRRGRIAVDAENSLDCTQLSVATPLVASTYVTRNTVYVGPEIDPSFLVNVYTEEWIDHNMSPQAIERLSREGADAIVDACIVTDRTVLARLQTSIAHAWDAADPNASAQIQSLR